MAELVPDDAQIETPPQGGLLGLLNHVVTWWAMAGGAVFCALVAMSIVSIVGRKLFSTPIQGDMEVLMMGAAVGSAAFLPVCELHDHHIKVDALTTWMSERVGGFEQFQMPWGLLTPAQAFGMFARRHMVEYGWTSEQFGAVAVALRTHGSMNPRAMMRKPITVADG